MAYGPRLHPALLFAVGGAALFLGVGAALPWWWVPLQHPLVMRHSEDKREWGTLWEAVAGAAMTLREFPQPWQGENVVVALVLLGVGAAAGLVGWSAWACLRTPLPPPGSEPAGR